MFDDVHFTALPNFAVDIGGGGFDEPGQQSFALADVNGDGRLDLITVEADQDRVAVRLRTDGSGIFALAATLETDILVPAAVIVADVASPFASEDAGAPDGKPDLIVGGEFDVDIFLGRGDGQFDPPEQELDEDLDFACVVGLVAQEFDGAPGTDLAVLDDDGVVTPLCNRSGLLQACADFPIELPDFFEPVDIVGGDFNGDGYRDLAVLDRGESAVAPLFGHGDGTFDASAPAIPVRGEGEESRDLAVGRINGDLLDDLVVANHGEFGAYLGVTLFGRRDRGFEAQAFVTLFRVAALALGDFNREPDGSLDVIVIGEGGTPGLNLNDGYGTLLDPFQPSGGRFPSVAAMAAGDLGGDARSDFIVLDTEGTTMQVAINDTSPLRPRCPGDCNCDGDVSIDELILVVGIALREPPRISCSSVDFDGSGRVTIAELIAAVSRALNGCPR